jgi:hypothetical protein
MTLSNINPQMANGNAKWQSTKMLEYCTKLQDIPENYYPQNDRTLHKLTVCQMAVGRMTIDQMTICQKCKWMTHSALLVDKDLING